MFIFFITRQGQLRAKERQRKKKTTKEKLGKLYF